MSSDANPHALAPGTRILDYTIQSVIGTGGFSIVYKALDNSLMREVAIKEYFPASLAQRDTGGTVQPHSREVETFRTGIVSFTNEGKLLAQFDHPALVRVYRCWEERGTAYLAMRLYTGVTLRDAVKSGSWSANEFSMHALLAPLCDTLELLHAANCYHRDVAPDNVLLSEGLAPVLLDFGAARKAIEGKQVFTAILKPGYAPIEQYGDGELKQGPWTDIYALAGVMHFALSGVAPPTAISRMLRDSLPPPREKFAGRLPDSWLDAMERALAVKPENRPQSIAEFVALFGWNEVAPLPVDPEPQTAIATVGPAGASAPTATLVSAPVLLPVPASPGTALMRDAARAAEFDDDRTVVMPRRPASALAPAPVQTVVQPQLPRDQASSAAKPTVSGSRNLWLGGAAAIAVAAIAAGVWQMSRPPASVSKGAAQTPPPPAAVQNGAPTEAKPSLPKDAAPKAVAPTVIDRPPDATTLTPPRATAKQESRPRESSARTRKQEAAVNDEDAADATTARASRQSARCVSLVESFQLGNVLSNEEQRFLRENCR